MSTTRATGTAAVKREAWGSIRKLASGRWQARYPAPDGETYTARTDDDKALTFLTKTDARTWLAGVHTTIARGEWTPPSTVAARRRAEAAAEKARSIGFAEYANRWIAMVRTEPKKNGKRRALGTVRSYQGKIDGYLVPEFGDLPIRELDIKRIRALTARLDSIPSPLNPKSKFNGVTRRVLTVLMMILRQAARDGLIPAAPAVSLPRQEAVIKDVDAGVDDDVATPDQVEALYEATPKQLAIMVLLAAWCQLRRAECLGLQRRDIEWLRDGGAILHVRRQLSANTGDYSNELKSEAGKRSLAVPRLMLERLEAHLRDHVAAEAKAPLVPTNVRGSVPLSNTRWGRPGEHRATLGVAFPPHGCRSFCEPSANSSAGALLRELLELLFTLGAAVGMSAGQLLGQLRRDLPVRSQNRLHRLLHHQLVRATPDRRRCDTAIHADNVFSANIIVRAEVFSVNFSQELPSRRPARRTSCGCH
jgi:integrase